jgi:hypothetical protein
MLVRLFRGTGRVFAVTREATQERLPAQLGPWTAVKTVELTRGEATPGVETDVCLDDIEKYGVHITDAHLRITESVI